MFALLLRILILIFLVNNVLVFKINDIDVGRKDDQRFSTSFESQNMNRVISKQSIAYEKQRKIQDQPEQIVSMKKARVSKVKSKKSSANHYKNKKKESKSTNQWSQIEFYKPASVIQRIKPKKREAILSSEEEFDSDEFIENDSDWCDELDTVRMPHLLGPSATHYSPIPVHHQHLSTFQTFQYGCYQLFFPYQHQFAINSGPYQNADVSSL
ncbi:uncharacterized protein LOC116352101 [Contarinia nasturtii]|uniref:uncharacterized protein LOC116352101 n=1 Tax=Contarinia nasturtii TaxID=265458 RepID=UPI0012D3E34D|nr:uncharacterized protein LOC116352101 [Contarinia nasturtii]